jgi:hypothetical protein
MKSCLNPNAASNCDLEDLQSSSLKSVQKKLRLSQRVAKDLLVVLRGQNMPSYTHARPVLLSWALPALCTSQSFPVLRSSVSDVLFPWWLLSTTLLL